MPAIAHAATQSFEPPDNYTKDMLLLCSRCERHVLRPMPDGWEHRLFAITTIAPSRIYGGVRTVGVCDSFERAAEIVEANEGDIWEHSYYLVVIEETRPNVLYGGLDDRNTYWYLWDDETKRYVSIDDPPWYRDVIGWGIG